MNVHTPSALSVNLQIPQPLLDLLTDQYEANDDLRFVTSKELARVKNSSLHKSCREAMASCNKERISDLQSSIFQSALQKCENFFPFTQEQAMDLAFHADQILEIHTLFAAGQVNFEELLNKPILLESSKWTKLQLVLMADHFGANPDVLGLVVGNAWKLGELHGLLSQNFSYQRCTELFLSSSQMGLNAIFASSSKPLGPVLYRGGDFSPTLASGMSWTNNKKIAEFFAKRSSNKVPIVVSTPTDKKQILARYEEEKEVVLSYDPDRHFELEFV